LFFSFRTHAETRALSGAVLAGAALGLVVSIAYLLTAQLRLSADEARVSRMTDAAVAGYSATPAAATPAAAPTALNAAPVPVQAQPAEHHIGVSGRELDCLATAVYYEARGETSEGQAAVAQVVLNRAKHPAYPKSVCAVVFQGANGHGCQFSFVCNGAMNHAREPAAWVKARDVASRALSGYVMTAIGQATAFHAAHGQVASVARGPGSVQLGRQVFYTASSHRPFVRGVHAPILTAQAAPVGAGQAATRLTFALGALTPVPASTGKIGAVAAVSPAQAAAASPTS